MDTVVKICPFRELIYILSLCLSCVHFDSLYGIQLMQHNHNVRFQCLISDTVTVALLCVKHVL